MSRATRIASSLLLMFPLVPSGTAAIGSGVFLDSGQRLGSSISDHVALADLDSDGDLDAFVANDDNQPNQVWLNSGLGTFIDSGQALGAQMSKTLDLGDVDGDGDFDAVVGQGAASAELWLNDGSASFTDSGQRISSGDTGRAVFGDLDGDDDLDIFVSRGFSSQASLRANQVWLNDGAGIFSDSLQALGDSHSQWVALGDLDGDGDLDAFVGNMTHPAAPVPAGNQVWLNDGTGVFSDAAAYTRRHGEGSCDDRLAAISCPALSRS